MKKRLIILLVITLMLSGCSLPDANDTSSTETIEDVGVDSPEDVSTEIKEPLVVEIEEVEDIEDVGQIVEDKDEVQTSDAKTFFELLEIGEIKGFEYKIGDNVNKFLKDNKDNILYSDSMQGSIFHTVELYSVFQDFHDDNIQGFVFGEDFSLGDFTVGDSFIDIQDALGVDYFKESILEGDEWASEKAFYTVEHHSGDHFISIYFDENNNSLYVYCF